MVEQFFQNFDLFCIVAPCMLICACIVVKLEWQMEAQRLHTLYKILFSFGLIFLKNLMVIIVLPCVSSKLLTQILFLYSNMNKIIAFG